MIDTDSLQTPNTVSAGGDRDSVTHTVTRTLANEVNAYLALKDIFTMKFWNTYITPIAPGARGVM